MYPWQQTIRQQLEQTLQRQQLPHALLFYGAAGIGKRNFAEAFANRLLCQQPQQASACGQCKACQLLAAGSHPDRLTLQPEEGSKEIKIDQVRAFIEKMSLTRHNDGYRVALIAPADAMNINASNSLLKTLEEPPANVLLLLISDKPSALSATIRSRCQKIRFDLPSTEQAQQWLQQQGVQQAELLLKLANGAPLAALALAEDDGMAIREQLLQNWQQLAEGQADPVQSAELWIKQGFKNKDKLPLYWLNSWIMDMIRHHQGADVASLANLDYAENLQKMARQVDLKSMFDLLDRVNDTLRLSEGAANLNNLVEGLLIFWAGLKRKPI